MRLSELAIDLVEVCKGYNLEYDPDVLPVKLTADCYIIYATHMSNQCHNHGDCRVEQFYALTGGDKIRIVSNVSN